MICDLCERDERIRNIAHLVEKHFGDKDEFGIVVLCETDSKEEWESASIPRKCEYLTEYSINEWNDGQQ